MRVPNTFVPRNEPGGMSNRFPLSHGRFQFSEATGEIPVGQLALDTPEKEMFHDGTERVGGSRRISAKTSSAGRSQSIGQCCPRRRRPCWRLGIEKDRAGPAFSRRRQSAGRCPLASTSPLRYSTGEYQGETPPMDDQETQTPAPDNEGTFTLYRFCLCRGLSLNDHERIILGIELSKLLKKGVFPLRIGVGPSVPGSGATLSDCPIRSVQAASR
jgi:hypothetical protein